jgi:hypothetical protein
MAVTTNYSWVTPDDTSLVKDGAAAIRTLGSSVDTTTKNLNPSTTLGDIEYRSSTANTNTRLGIGTTGQVLTVAGGVPSWAAAATGGMTLISTTTANNDASISLSSIPQTYVHLQVIVKNFRCSSDNNQFCFRYNNNSGTSYRRIVGTTADNASYDFNEDKARLVNGLDSVETYNHLVINIPNYADSTIWKMAESRVTAANGTTPTNTASMQNLAICHNQTAAITSLVFFMDSGNIAAGTFLLYGVK